MTMRRNSTLLCVAVAALGLTACSGSKRLPGTGSGPEGTDPGSPPTGPTSTDRGSFVDGAGLTLAYPTRIAAASDGTVYVSDAMGHRVLGFREGAVTVALTGLDRPLGLAVSGDLLYVGNAGRKDVEVYSLGERRFLRTLPGGFEMPNAIAVAPDGVAYVVDSRLDVVRVFGADDSALESIGGSGAGDGQLAFPSSVAADATRVVVGDRGNHRVQVFDRSGQFLRSLGREMQKAESAEDAKGGFTAIASVALSGSDIYVLDSTHAHVQVLDELGTSKGFFGYAGECESCVKLALDIAVAPDGQVLATDPENRRWVSLSTELR
jgi:DNA-binding beta-propeller fold protein YncE